MHCMTHARAHLREAHTVVDTVELVGRDAVDNALYRAAGAVLDVRQAAGVVVFT